MRTASNRLVTFGVVVFVCVLLIALSLSGILGPVASSGRRPADFRPARRRQPEYTGHSMDNAVGVLAEFAG